MKMLIRFEVQFYQSLHVVYVYLAFNFLLLFFSEIGESGTLFEL